MEPNSNNKPNKNSKKRKENKADSTDSPSQRISVQKDHYEKIKQEISSLKSEKNKLNQIIDSLKQQVENFQLYNKHGLKAEIKSLKTEFEKIKHENCNLKNEKNQLMDSRNRLWDNINSFKNEISLGIKNSLDLYLNSIEEINKISFEKNQSYLKSIEDLEKDIGIEKTDDQFFLSEDLYCGSEKRCIEDFSCLICLNTVMDPLQCVKCDKLFCNNCIKNHLDINDFCPNCRHAPFSRTNFSRLLEKILDKSEFKCPIQCEEKFLYSELDKHKSQCQKVENENSISSICFRDLNLQNQVENENSISSLWFKDLNLQNQVEDERNGLYKNMHCVFCCKQFQKCELIGDQKICGNRFKFCKDSKMYIPIKYADAHENFYKRILILNRNLISDINKSKNSFINYSFKSRKQK